MPHDCGRAQGEGRARSWAVCRKRPRSSPACGPSRALPRSPSASRPRRRAGRQTRRSAAACLMGGGAGRGSWGLKHGAAGLHGKPGLPPPLPFWCSWRSCAAACSRNRCSPEGPHERLVAGGTAAAAGAPLLGHGACAFFWFGGSVCWGTGAAAASAAEVEWRVSAAAAAAALAGDFPSLGPQPLLTCSPVCSEVAWVWLRAENCGKN